MLGKGKFWHWKQIRGDQELGVIGTWGLMVRVSVWGNKKVLEADGDGGTTLYVINTSELYT